MTSVGYAPLASLYRPFAVAVERAGHAYPAAFEAHVGLRVEELAEPALPDPELLAAGRHHLDQVLGGAPGVHDGPVLAMAEVEGALVRARSSGYFAAVATADALRAEWEREGAGPLRKRAHALAGLDPLRDGHGRAAAVGVAVAATHEDKVLLGRRSASLAADPGLWHVAPSGMLEPGASVGAQIARELLEELGVGHAARPQALGLGFDLLRLRPELCFRLELEDVSVDLSEEFEEGHWMDLAGEWPAELTPAAAATLALLEVARWSQL